MSGQKEDTLFYNSNITSRVLPFALPHLYLHRLKLQDTFIKDKFILVINLYHLQLDNHAHKKSKELRIFKKSAHIKKQKSPFWG